HGGEQVPLAVVVELTEPQRVEDGDRPGAHRGDVAEDAADTRRGTLKRLDGGRGVVTLDLEGDGQGRADRDHARVLARPLKHALTGGGESPQQRLRMLVAAVLAPEQRVDGQLEIVGIASQLLVDTVELAIGEAESAMQRLRRDGVQSLRNPTPGAGSTQAPALRVRAPSR